MEVKNGLLSLAVYMTATALIVLTALVAIFHYAARERVPAWMPDSEPLPELAVAERPASAHPTPSAVMAGSRGMEQQRIRLLEHMLEEKTRRLQSESEMVRLRTAELADLRARYDAAIAMVVDSMSHTSANDGSSPPDRLADPANKPPGQETWEEELSVARATHDALASDVAVLQDELAKVQQELDQLRALREREASEHVREIQFLEATATGVLVRVGQPSVPVLRDLLNHPSPAVRRWGATMLGAIGPDAHEAVSALTEALSDNDAGVRGAVQAALLTIAQ